MQMIWAPFSLQNGIIKSSMKPSTSLPGDQCDQAGHVSGLVPMMCNQKTKMKQRKMGKERHVILERNAMVGINSFSQTQDYHSSFQGASVPLCMNPFFTNNNKHD
jgi:hypothetical protein